MSTSSKTKVLVGAVVFLLLANIAILVFFLCCKGPGKKDPRSGGKEAIMKEFLQKEIGFTPQQMAQYDSLSKQHKENIKASFNEMRNNKEQQFRELGRNAFSDSSIALAANRSSEMQKEMEIKMIQHFKEIRKLCNADQQPKFDSLFYKVWNKRDQKQGPKKNNEAVPEKRKDSGKTQASINKQISEPEPKKKEVTDPAPAPVAGKKKGPSKNKT